MPYQLPKLPYGYDELAPHIGPQTVEIHYDKHHRAYVDKLNELADGGIESEDELRKSLRASGGDVFNQAAQVWNHNFYWKCMDPKGGGEPGRALAERLAESFGAVERFRAEFLDAAGGHFGSGWAWLVRDPAGQLRVTTTSDAENPLVENLVPLLTVDVWEHAYYLDYQNERGEYLERFMDHLVNWRFVEKNLERGSYDADGVGLKEMMLHPGEVFDTPDEILSEPKLSREQRIEVLRQWRDEITQRQAATEENLIGDERTGEFLATIDQALIRLSAD